MNDIDLISEIETCVYEIHVNSRSMCDVPNFRKEKNKFDIVCRPVVDDFLELRPTNRFRFILKLKSEIYSRLLFQFFTFF